MSKWSWSARIGTLTRIECTVSLSTLNSLTLSRCIRVVSAPSALKLKPGALGQPGREVDVEPQPLAQLANPSRRGSGTSGS